MFITFCGTCHLNLKIYNHLCIELGLDFCWKLQRIAKQLRSKNKKQKMSLSTNLMGTLQTQKQKTIKHPHTKLC
jgi:hypothetical protein